MQISRNDNILRQARISATESVGQAGPAAQSAANNAATGNSGENQLTLANLKSIFSRIISTLVLHGDYLGELSDMDRVSDVVKSIRDFSGNPGEFSSWKKRGERILKLYNHLHQTPKCFGILNVIRSNIIDQANEALESYNTPLNWEHIACCLILHCANKRDLGALEYQMTCLLQVNGIILDFYQSVYLSLILTKISCMDMSLEATNVLVHAYREKAIDMFIKGLEGNLPKLLSMREPADLSQTLRLCLKMENGKSGLLHPTHQ